MGPQGEDKIGTVYANVKRPEWLPEEWRYSVEYSHLQRMHRCSADRVYNPDTADADWREVSWIHEVHNNAAMARAAIRKCDADHGVTPPPELDK